AGGRWAGRPSGGRHGPERVAVAGRPAAAAPPASGGGTGRAAAGPPAAVPGRPDRVGTRCAAGPGRPRSSRRWPPWTGAGVWAARPRHPPTSGGHVPGTHQATQGCRLSDVRRAPELLSRSTRAAMRYILPPTLYQDVAHYR